MDEAELKQRTKQFALRCMRLTDGPPVDAPGRAIANQLVRSGTSVGANHRAARRARSSAKFVSKLAVVEIAKMMVASVRSNRAKKSKIRNPKSKMDGRF